MYDHSSLSSSRNPTMLAGVHLTPPAMRSADCSPQERYSTGPLNGAPRASQGYPVARLRSSSFGEASASPPGGDISPQQECRIPPRPRPGLASRRSRGSPAEADEGEHPAQGGWEGGLRGGGVPILMISQMRPGTASQ